jgi:hypothetical protein
MYYHPNIRSDTCPSIPLLGDCPTGTPLIAPGVPGPAVTPPFPPQEPGGGWTIGGFPPAPDRLNAEAEGASLIGVPTVGVELIWWGVEMSSTDMRLDWAPES